MSSSHLRHLGRTGIEISPLTLGTMNFGGGRTGEDDSIRIVRRALDAGINAVDTADVYAQGESERIVGRALKGRRDEVILASKFHGNVDGDPTHQGNSRWWIQRAVEDSLRRLDVDHLDLYQVHRPESQTALDETIGALDDLVRQGKIRHHGTSVFGPDELIEAQWSAERHRWRRPVSEQVPYSLLIRGIERETLPVARTYGLGVLTFGPLAAGWLSGAYRRGAPQPETQRAEMIPGRFDVTLPGNAAKLAAADALAQLAEEAGLTLIHLAIGFALNHPDVSSVIIGPRTLDHLESQLGAVDVRLGADVLDRIDEIVPPGHVFHERDTGTVREALARPELRRTVAPAGT